MEPVRELTTAVRAVLRRPGLTALAVVALGLGIGLPTAMFAILQGVALRGLPVEDPHEVMVLEQRPLGASGEGWGVSQRDWRAWSERQRSFEALAAYRSTEQTVRTGDGALRVSGVSVTAGLFSLLRVAPVQGRGFSTTDRNADEPPVLVSHAFWRDRIGADRDALATTLFIDDQPHRVIGVMPEGFAFPAGQVLWTLLEEDAEAVATGTGRRFSVIGRLADGVSVRTARAEMEQVAAALAGEYPDTNEGMSATVKPITHQFMGETPMTTMRVMLAAVSLVLLVAAFNVANLLLVRTVERVRELAIRAALGASRARLLRQMFLEAAVLASAGAALGVGLAVLAMRGFEGLVREGRLGWWTRFELDLPTLGLVVAFAIVGALLAGVFPALRALRTDVGATLKEEGRGSPGRGTARLMGGLVVAELALSVALLVAAGLLMGSVVNVRSVQERLSAHEVFTARVALPDSEDAQGRAAFLAELTRALESEPGVASVGFAGALPGERAGFRRIQVDGRPQGGGDDGFGVRTVRASEGFFAPFGATPLQGRTFSVQDGPEAPPVAIVNRRFTERHLPGMDPLGARIRFVGDSAAPWVTIVGVVPDLYAGGMDASGDRNPAALYLPAAQAPPRAFGYAVNVTAPGSFALRFRSAVAAVDPTVPVFQEGTLAALIEDNSWFYGLGTVIMGACAVAALLLALIGLYGVVAFSVGSRIREFGIRMAVGAAPGGILALVFRRSLGQMLLGLGLGFGLALVVARGLSSLLFGVPATDVRVFGIVALTLTLASLAAVLVPGLRATRVDPLDALRSE